MIAPVLDFTGAIIKESLRNVYISTTGVSSKYQQAEVY